MITVEYCRRMAAYNAWQNAGLVAAASGLSDAERRADRGAFFGSIHGTLVHLLWGDTVWMSRFDGWEKPGNGIPESPRFVDDWDTYVARRQDADARIADWAAHRVTEDWLAGRQTWYSGVLGREVTRPAAFNVTHFFNHQTHHRGQVHAMLTAAGAVPGDTDLFVMPGVD